jgi:hypothetical protein
MHKYLATIARSEVSGYHYVPLPPAIVAVLKEEKHRRLLLHIGGVVHRRALISFLEIDGHGIITGKDVLAAHGLSIGDTVSIGVEVDPNPDDLGLPEELEVWLEQDEKAAKIWSNFTPGRQRSMCYYVTSAKRAETRFKRAEELINKMKTGTLYSQTHGR